ncbi:nucleoside transporter C-terminal domain-containing protein [Phenylobacterium sp.]|jgi:CNT family concentrative nucleoside transporter|uniref:NupC/NupG family nucleoside CNT transporter n=1 Tax=Phenylobacterium sp. TaxID=1871053 RepID=UPI0025D3E6DD|nr:nucleoside transporter C-terminal domain-containing protein [Phenylobacterium sp.]MCA6287447.1 NupC/NupG family nucleoside CNT transporter [Phenylobacterium sp.]MCA6288236.1 NupC/NupG family nucleoside CNT transporter [Phenylobacterium sp.]MCA6311556.1 NupC/NupG family nucleoside CNT transporter [Phenylobacterium sp.]MCA6324106.1 NupC/NupG family nucleoside CNT transporter [Phenylobacterium sp.]MCA6337758.1 NupC/NupG family nucleoside CNT transporter [Phenylobacterium sp.]
MFRAENTQSLLGLAVIMGLCWALSENRRVFPWRLAAGALLIQLLLVLGLFGLPPLRAVVAALGQGVEALAAATQTGVAFVFGFLAGGEGQPYGVSNPGALFVFAFRVLPVILVVCALAALLWHWGILKAVTRAFGFVFEKTMGLRGPPALAVGATIFMGQVEGPIFIRSYLARLSRSELFMLITVGMSCVAGSTMVAYAAILKDVLPNAAAHIITASVISAPAGVLLARILVPRDVAAEQAEPLETGSEKAYESSIDAVSRGVSDGLQIALNIGATLIVFVALAAIVNGMLGLLPDIAGAPLTLERILGVLFAPLVWLIGVPAKDAQIAGALLGVKLVLTEFTAFIQLGATPVEAIDPRTRVLMAYALCGFANIASVGMNVAGYSVLVPERRSEVIGMVWKAMFAGFLATCLSAAVVGLLPRELFH